KKKNQSQCTELIHDGCSHDALRDLLSISGAAEVKSIPNLYRSYPTHLETNSQDVKLTWSLSALSITVRGFELRISPFRYAPCLYFHALSYKYTNANFPF